MDDHEDRSVILRRINARNAAYAGLSTLDLPNFNSNSQTADETGYADEDEEEDRAVRPFSIEPSVMREKSNSFNGDKTTVPPTPKPLRSVASPNQQFHAPAPPSPAPSSSLPHVQYTSTSFIDPPSETSSSSLGLGTTTGPFTSTPLERKAPYASKSARTAVPDSPVPGRHLMESTSTTQSYSTVKPNFQHVQSSARPAPGRSSLSASQTKFSNGLRKKSFEDVADGKNSRRNRKISVSFDVDTIHALSPENSALMREYSFDDDEEVSPRSSLVRSPSPPQELSGEASLPEEQYGLEDQSSPLNRDDSIAPSVGSYVPSEELESDEEKDEVLDRHNHEEEEEEEENEEEMRDVLVPLKDDSLVSYPTVAATPARKGWVTNRRGPSRTQGYPSTRNLDNLSPLSDAEISHQGSPEPLENNRIPSLSRSSDHSGGSERDLMERMMMMKTPDIGGDESMERFESPPRVFGRFDRGNDDDEEEAQMDDQKDGSRMNTTGSQFTTPGTARHLSRHDNTTRDFSIGYDGTPTSQIHERSVLEDVTGISQAMDGSPIMRISTPDTPKAGDRTKSYMPQNVAMLIMSEQKRTRASGRMSLNGLGLRAKRGRLSSGSGTSGSTPSPEQIGQWGNGSLVGMGMSPNANGAESSVGDISMVSISSSADLTTDRRGSARTRANTSVPNVMPSDIGSHETGVNQGKLVKHLSGVNKALEKENKDLTMRLQELESGVAGDSPGMMSRVSRSPGEQSQQGLSPYSERSYRDGSQAPGDSTSDMLAELQNRIIELEAERTEQSAKVQALEAAKVASRDATDGDNDIVQALEDKLKEYEALKEERALEMEGLRDRLADGEALVLAKEAALDELVAKYNDEQTENAQAFEALVESEREKFNIDIKAKDKVIQQLEYDKQAVENEKDRLRQILDSDGEDEKVKALQSQVQALEAELSEQQHATQEQDRAAQLELSVKVSEIEQLQKEQERFEAEAKKMDAMFAELDTALATSEDARLDLEQQLQTSEKRVSEASSELTRTKVDLKSCTLEKAQAISEKNNLSASVEQLEEQVRELTEQNRDLSDRATQEQDRLHEELAAEQTIVQELEQQVSALSKDIAHVQEEFAVEREKVETDAGNASLIRHENDRQHDEINALQVQLAKAEEKAARLARDAMSQSPAQKVALEAKETRIKTLTEEKALLNNRIRILSSQAQVRNTPAKSASGSRFLPSPAITPFKQRLLKLNDPKTPGSLADASWMNSSIGNVTDTSALEEVERLQHELHMANRHLDDNFDRLEAAGLTTYNIAERLAATVDRATEMELVVQQLTANDADLRRRLAVLKCPECETTVDANDALQNADTGDKTISGSTHGHQTKNELRAAIREMRAQQSDLKAETHTMRTRLQTRIADLQSELESAEARVVEESNRAAEDMANAYNQRQTMTDNISRLETELASLKAVHRQCTAAAQFAEREQRLTNEADQVKTRKIAQLQAAVNAAEQKLAEDTSNSDHEAVRHLEDQLRQATAELSSASRSAEQSDKARRNIQNELDRSNRELSQANSRLQAKHRELHTVANDLEKVQASLKVNIANTQKLSFSVVELENKQTTIASLRSELSKLRGASDEYESVIMSMRNDLEESSRVLLERELELKDYTSNAVIKQEEVEELLRKKDALTFDRKRLTSQLRYVNSKCTRESTFRKSLQIQKMYLLCLIGKFKQTERETIRAIAQMGYPAQGHESSGKRSLKSVATAIVATIRMKRLAENWRAVETARR